jgi:hypothetical protein
VNKRVEIGVSVAALVAIVLVVAMHPGAGPTTAQASHPTTTPALRPPTPRPVVPTTTPALRPPTPRPVVPTTTPALRPPTPRPVVPTTTPALRPPTPRPVVPTATPTPDLWGGLWTAAGFTWLGLLVALPVLIVLAAGAAIVSAVWRRHTRLGPDLEVPLRDRHALDRVLDVHVERARAAGMPERLTWHDSRRLALSGQPPEVAKAAIAAITAPPVLPWTEIVPGQGLLLGIRPDGSRLVAERLESVAVGGQPGSGKSSTAAVLIAQHAARSAEIWVADPHSGLGESLASRLSALGVRITQLADSPRELVGLVARVRAELARRLQRRTAGRPLVLAIDELPSLIRDRAVAAAVVPGLEDVAQQGRKLGLWVVAIGQSWTVSQAGSSGLRNPIPMAVLHRMRPDDARWLAGIPVPGVEALRTGEAIVARHTGLERVWVPMPEGALPAPTTDFRDRLPRPTSDRLPTDSRPTPDRLPTGDAGSRLEVGPEAPEVTPEVERRIVEALLRGQSPGAIARDLAGGAKAGRAWANAHDQVLAVLRSRLREAGGEV